MLNKLTSTLRPLIVSTIVSVIALVIGIVLLPVYAVFATVIITLSALEVLYFGYALVKYIISHRPAKKEKTVKTVKTVKTTKNWRDWVIILTLIGVIIIIILLCKGCGNSDVLNVKTINADVANIGTENVTTSNVETENVETENVETENVTTSNVDTQNVIEQDVETSNVTEQEVVNQTVTEQDVETSNVTEQVVVRQQVTNQTVKTTSSNVSSETSKTEATVSAEPSETTKHSATTSTASSGTAKPSATTSTTQSETSKNEEPAPVHECSAEKTNKIDATCTTEGKVEEVCSCGKVISSETIPATGHTWDKGEITKKATEEAAGTKKYTCTECGETKSEEVPKIDHVCKVVDTNTKKATCTEKGTIEEICSCGKVISSTTTPATGHSWNKGEITREATEKRTGIKTYTCKKCDQEKTETIDKLEHECEICDEIEIEATCTTKGKIKYVCDCGEVLDTETLPKLGHDYEVFSEREATATRDGYIKYRCNNCGDTYEETIPATGEEEEEEPKDEKPEEVCLTTSSYIIHEGDTVKVTTTGSASNLKLQQSMEQLKMTKISDTQVELTVKTPGVGGTVSVYDETTGASIEITIEFVYD